MPRLGYRAVIMLRSAIAKSKVKAICVHWGARSLVAVDARFLLDAPGGLRRTTL